MKIVIGRYYTVAPKVRPLSLTGHIFSRLMGGLKLQSNTTIGTLAVDGWAVSYGTAKRNLSGLRLRPGPSSLFQMYEWVSWILCNKLCDTSDVCAKWRRSRILNRMHSAKLNSTQLNWTSELSFALYIGLKLVESRRIAFDCNVMQCN